jgi:hypothetical protein
VKTEKAPARRVTPHVEWLDRDMAAIYLGFVDPLTGAPKVQAFETWKSRERKEHKRPRQHRLRGSLRFRRVDLDQCVEAEAEVSK